jgi:hypothetical protein
MHRARRWHRSSLGHPQRNLWASCQQPNPHRKGSSLRDLLVISTP